MYTTHLITQLFVPISSREPVTFRFHSTGAVTRKRIEQLGITLSTAVKMLERMQANQKRHYQHQRATHKLQVGDLVLLKKHNTDKMDLRWEPNYKLVRLMSPWSAVVENPAQLVELQGS